MGISNKITSFPDLRSKAMGIFNKITSFPDLRSKAMGISNKITSFPDTRRVAMGISNNYLLVYLYMSICQSSGYRPLWHFEFCILNFAF